MDDTGGSPRVDGELELAAIAAALWSRKWLILLVTGVSLALGGLYAAVATPLYEASVEVVPPLPAGLEGPLGVADLELAYGERERWLTRLSAFRRGLLQVDEPMTREAVFVNLARRGFEIDVQDAETLQRHVRAVRLLKPPQRGERSRIIAFDHENGEFALAVIEALITQVNLDASALFAQELRFEMDGLARMLQVRLDHAMESRAQIRERDGGTGVPASLEALIVELETRVATLNEYVQRDYPPVQMLGIEGGIVLSREPVRPRVAQVLVLAALGGLVLGVILAAASIARERSAG